jgi:hypothetical protein
MVHALQETRRVLAPGGILIDLRPVGDNWPVELVTGRETREAGRVSDLPLGREDDAAANAAMEHAAQDRLFQRQQEEFFPFHYYWDSPSDMQKYVEEEWQDFIGIDEPVWKSIRSLWAVANADARLRVRVKMLIARWQRLE